MLAGHRQWPTLDDGIDVASINYESPGWGKTRRMVMVRQLITRRPKATGKTLRLFADDIEYRHYRHGFFVTSLDLPAALSWKIYRMRADAENLIKELKYDFGADSFNIKNFSATEGTMNFIMLSAIELDNNLSFKADKINNIFLYRMLTPEFETT